MKINEMNKVIINFGKKRNVFEANRFEVDKKLSGIIKKDARTGKTIEVEMYERGKLRFQSGNNIKGAFVVSYKYNDNGNCIGIRKYHNGTLENEKRYEYDNFFGTMYSVPTKEIDNGKEYGYIYSNNYKCIEKTVYNGIEVVSITMITNEINNTIVITKNRGDSLNLRFFDNSLYGNIVKDITRNEDIIYDYDNKDRLTGESIQFGGSKVRVTYDWNENNEIIEETYDCAPYHYIYEYYYR